MTASDVHLLERHAAILDPLPRHDLEVAHLRLGLGAAVRLDEADDDVDSAGRRRCASWSMRYVLPMPAAEPMYTLSLPAIARADEVGKGRLGGDAGHVGHPTKSWRPAAAGWIGPPGRSRPDGGPSIPRLPRSPATCRAGGPARERVDARARTESRRWSRPPPATVRGSSSGASRPRRKLWVPTCCGMPLNRDPGTRRG